MVRGDGRAEQTSTDAKIARVEFATYRVPLPAPVRSATISISHRELLIVRVTTDDGITGIGWGATAGVAITAAAALLRDYLLPGLVGTRIFEADATWHRLWNRVHFPDAGGISTLALGPLDIALWDVRAKLARVPLHRLLGGYRDRVFAYASAINFHLDQGALVDQARQFIEQGFGGLKMKIGRPDFGQDLKRVRAVREVIGSGRKLYLDANQAWTAAEAVQACHALEEVDPAWIEEPILSDDVAGHADLRRRVRMPVALGESLSNRYEFWNFVRESAVDVLQPNPWKVGGITEWMRIASLAAVANLRVAPHASIELSSHLCAAVAPGLGVERLFGGDLGDLGVLRSQLRFENGEVVLSETPGHAVEFAWDRLAPHAVLHACEAGALPDV